jgi:hypothetical protein
VEHGGKRGVSKVIRLPQHHAPKEPALEKERGGVEREKRDIYRERDRHAANCNL